VKSSDKPATVDDLLFLVKAQERQIEQIRAQLESLARLLEADSKEHRIKEKR
jgi:hypothetical protein